MTRMMPCWFTPPAHRASKAHGSVCDICHDLPSLRCEVAAYRSFEEHSEVCGCDLRVGAEQPLDPSILERIKYQGSEANPANVTANVLAQLFGLDEIAVAESVYNAAPYVSRC